jgi:hypothetical protein
MSPHRARWGPRSAPCKSPTRVSRAHDRREPVVTGTGKEEWDPLLPLGLIRVCSLELLMPPPLRMLKERTES